MGVIRYDDYYKSLIQTIRLKQDEFDKRKDRMDYLLEKFEAYQSVNREQAEAYLERVGQHQPLLEDQIVEISKLRMAAQEYLRKAG